MLVFTKFELFLQNVSSIYLFKDILFSMCWQKSDVNCKKYIHLLPNQKQTSFNKILHMSVSS